VAHDDGQLGCRFDEVDESGELLDGVSVEEVHRAVDEGHPPVWISDGWAGERGVSRHRSHPGLLRERTG
jgi:predicted nicotinamide N-methyase